VSEWSNKQSKLAEENSLESLDYSLLEQLFSFLDSDKDLQAILCGYVNKVVQSLLNRYKMKLMYYVLIHREGQLFNKLLNHLEQHSLA